MHSSNHRINCAKAARRAQARVPGVAPPGTRALRRIVGMTAHAMQGGREECLAAGREDDVTKPIRLDALVQELVQELVQALPKSPPRGLA